MRGRPFLFAIALIAAWGLLSAACYVGWIHGTDHRDFYPRWAGAQLALFEGRDLYSVETTHEMQRMLYGREIPPDLDQQGFAYPAVLIPVLLPFWFIPNVEVATALWEGASILAVLGSLLLVRSLWGRAPRWWALILLLWYYTVLMIFQAQMQGFLLLVLGVGLWASLRQRDLLAGVVLSLAIIKPEQMAVPVAALVLWALFQQRWRLVGAFLAGVGLLFAASLVISGWWVPGWLDAVASYSQYAAPNWSFSGLAGFHPLLAGVYAVLLIVTLAAMRWQWPGLTVAAGLPLGIILLPQTSVWGMAILTLPLMLAWRGAGRWWAGGVWLAGWILPFVTTSIPGGWRLENALLPLLALMTVAAASRTQESRIPL